MAVTKKQQATGAAAIAMSLTPKAPMILTSVRLHMDDVGGLAENFTVTINSATAGAYDVVIFSQDMNAVKDLLWVPDQPVAITNLDVVDFAYNNGNARTYGLEVTYQRES